MNHQEFCSLLNIATSCEVFRKGAPWDHVIIWYGWRICRTMGPLGHADYTAVPPKGLSRAEAIKEYGLDPETIDDLFAAQKTVRSGEYQVRRWKIGRRTFFWAHKRKPQPIRKKAEPKKRPVTVAVDPTKCAVCGCSLTPRRTVVLNNVRHCYTCNRQAFIGNDLGARRALAPG